MEASVTRSLGRLERILTAHECVSCVQSGLVCRELAIVLWNTVAFEIVTVIELANLKRELMRGLYEVVSRKGAMEATDTVHLDTCNLIKGIAGKSVQNYFSECSTLIQDSDEVTSAQHSYFTLMDKATEKLDLFLSYNFSEGLEYFLEPMICPLARIFLERQGCTLELRTGTCLFQYIVRHMGKSASKYDTLLCRFILKFLKREDYKDESFRLGYSDVVDLLGTIAEFGKDIFKAKICLSQFWTENFFQACYSLLNITEATCYDPHLDSKVYGQLKLNKFAHEGIPYLRDGPRTCWTVLHLRDPLRFENYERMQFIYDTYLELLEIDYSNGCHVARWYIEDDMISRAFSRYFQQRRQRGDDWKVLESRLITALGGSDFLEQKKITCESYKTRLARLSAVPRKLPSVEASTQTDDDAHILV